MILLKRFIESEINRGRIKIDPYIPENLGVNSYDVRIANHLIRFNQEGFRTENEYMHYLQFEPGYFYLARTMEKVGSDFYVPMLETRSSIARLGMTIHLSAGVGDIGFYGFWTLEITVEKPAVIPVGSRVGQIIFHVPLDIDDNHELYNGKYQNNEGIQTSLLHLDKERKK